MYYFTIGAIFKNESHILKEWIEHYLYHGIEHIYLINDYSTDNYLEILKPFIDNNKVTLYDCKIIMKNVNCQHIKYNLYFQKHLKETKWFGIFDLDEFLYSPIEIDLKNVLEIYENENLLHINWVNFGSSGFKIQPKKVVSNFINRGDYDSIKNGPDGRYNSYKSIVKTDGNIKLGIHTHYYNNIKLGKNVSFNEKNTPLLINHYVIQSLEFWINVKMTRGDADNWYNAKGWERNIKLFNDTDTNHNKDTRLKQQNDKINIYLEDNS